MTVVDINQTPVEDKNTITIPTNPRLIASNHLSPCRPYKPVSCRNIPASSKHACTWNTNSTSSSLISKVSAGTWRKQPKLLCHTEWRSLGDTLPRTAAFLWAGLWWLMVTVDCTWTVTNPSVPCNTIWHCWLLVEICWRWIKGSKFYLQIYQQRAWEGRGVRVQKQERKFSPFREFLGNSSWFGSPSSWHKAWEMLSQESTRTKAGFS